MRWLVTGGAGFIGSHLVRSALAHGWADQVVVLDALTYAGNLENLTAVEEHPGFRFVRGDVAEPSAVAAAFKDGVDAVFHLAAESHVDRSIEAAAPFVRTNVLGTQVLVDLARAAGVRRFVQVSTDEVYGTLALDSGERFTEASPLKPSSPYAASKAAADHLVLAQHRTFGFDAVVTRASNNYGPYQFPEKFIPLCVTHALESKPLPLYGDGRHVRDWLHVDAHVRGLHSAFLRGRAGEIYNLGGECERANVDVARAICAVCGVGVERIEQVRDRPGHDRRYALAIDKARGELGFDPGPPIESRLSELVTWYRNERAWWERVKAGEYRSYYERRYAR
ncbi:MAG: dTDP-glucose 4,6-dehydratase [Deltaproteobacteria bacterium]|nr:dTDP-glucose 4,6-dehydratase [Deltaproteobacteria bacterium]